MVESLQLGLRFGIQDRAYRVGELVDFTLVVRNTGSKAITLVDYIPLTGWAPTVRTVDGKRLPIITPPIAMPVKMRKNVLKPGNTLEIGTVFLQLDADPKERGQTPHVYLTPGKYLVNQVYRFQSDKEATWSGELITGDITLSVADAPPTKQPVVDLMAVADLLTKKVGGRWEVDLHNAFPTSFRVVRGRIYSEPGKVLVSYVLFPIGPKDTKYQRTLAKAYEKAKGIHCLGATEQFIVLESARGDKAPEWSKKVAKTLKLQPFSMGLTKQPAR